MINIEFDILPLYDPGSLYVVDRSSWGPIEDKPSIIEIIVPGERVPYTHYFSKKQVNIFNASNLGLNCTECQGFVASLPDGIYQITVKGSPDTFNLTKNFLKTDNTRASLDKYVASASLRCDCPVKEFIDKVQKINFFIEAADSNTRLGNFREAQELLFKAQKMISKLEGCRTCA